MWNLKFVFLDVDQWPGLVDIERNTSVVREEMSIETWRHLHQVGNSSAVLCLAAILSHHVTLHGVQNHAGKIGYLFAEAFLDEVLHLLHQASSFPTPNNNSRVIYANINMSNKKTYLQKFFTFPKESGYERPFVPKPIMRATASSILCIFFSVQWGLFVFKLLFEILPFEVWNTTVRIIVTSIIRHTW